MAWIKGERISVVLQIWSQEEVYFFILNNSRLLFLRPECVMEFPTMFFSPEDGDIIVMAVSTFESTRRDKPEQYYRLYNSNNSKSHKFIIYFFSCMDVCRFSCCVVLAFEVPLGRTDTLFCRS
jgi:hypothetical protein